MYTLYPRPHHPSFPRYYYDDDTYRDDYYHALAAHRARELQEAQYRAQIEDAIARRAYQAQLARAQEAARRKAAYNPFSSMGGFDLQDNYDPYSNFAYHTQNDQNYDDYMGSYIQPRKAMRRRDSSAERSRSPRCKVSPMPEVRTMPRKKSPSPFTQRTPSPQPVQNSAFSQREAQRTSSPQPTHSSQQDAQHIPSPKLDGRDQAARRIQSFFRAQLPRLKALNQISAIARHFESLASQFTFPDSLDFSESATTPTLLYTRRNASLHGYDHALVKLLSKLDAVESHGYDSVRKARKQLVNRIERELAMLDEKKMQAWEAFQSTLSTTPVTSLEPSPSLGDDDMLGTDATVDRIQGTEDVPMVETALAETSTNTQGIEDTPMAETAIAETLTRDDSSQGIKDIPMVEAAVGETVTRDDNGHDSFEAGVKTEAEGEKDVAEAEAKDEEDVAEAEAKDKKAVPDVQVTV